MLAVSHKTMVSVLAVLVRYHLWSVCWQPYVTPTLRTELELSRHGLRTGTTTGESRPTSNPWHSFHRVPQPSTRLDPIAIAW